MSIKMDSWDMGKVTSLCSKVLLYNDLATVYLEDYNVLKGADYIILGGVRLKPDSPIYEAAKGHRLEYLQKQCELCQAESFRLAKELSLLDCHW